MVTIHAVKVGDKVISIGDVVIVFKGERIIADIVVQFGNDVTPGQANILMAESGWVPIKSVR